jgi:hypothetical protein
MTATAAPSSRERLGRLLDLAAGGAGARTALLGQLADLLFDWPADYAQAMRAPFEALFEKTAREADAATRAALAARLADHAELPVALLNEFFLDAAEPMRADILRRNDARDDAMPKKLHADAADDERRFRRCFRFGPVAARGDGARDPARRPGRRHRLQERGPRPGRLFRDRAAHRQRSRLPRPIRRHPASGRGTAGRILAHENLTAA